MKIRYKTVKNRQVLDFKEAVEISVEIFLQPLDHEIIEQ